MSMIRLALKNYIQPFERALAIAEIESLAGCKPRVCNDGGKRKLGDFVEIDFSGDATELINRLTYTEVVDSGEMVVTEQARRELSALERRRPFIKYKLDTANIKLPKRRYLRYGPHGIHEYRGKFFPQLVRSLLNIAQLNERDTVLDPMCGSGTTCVEALALGIKPVGLDRNALSVLISQSKCDVLGMQPGALFNRLDAIQQEIVNISALDLSEFFKKPDQDYLLRWFREDILSNLVRIRFLIEQLRNSKEKRFFLVVLSNVLRRLSWQKEDDLRVRKDVSKQINKSADMVFLDEATKSVYAMESYLKYGGTSTAGKAQINLGDARRLNMPNESVDAIITSPPYATALPYIDTDRLSLCLLGLELRANHRWLETEMIGNREVNKTQKAQYWSDYLAARNSLPCNVTELIDTIEKLNQVDSAGFRRKNLAALLAKYFMDMRLVIREARRVLKPKAPCYMIIGNNHTIANGVRIGIRTSKLLSEIAKAEGANHISTQSMEVLKSRDIFRKNASSTESIIEMRF